MRASTSAEHCRVCSSAFRLDGIIPATNIHSTNLRDQKIHASQHELARQKFPSPVKMKGEVHGFFAARASSPGCLDPEGSCGASARCSGELPIADQSFFHFSVPIAPFAVPASPLIQLLSWMLEQYQPGFVCHSMRSAVD
jgi:hypothetical protein